MDPTPAPTVVPYKKTGPEEWMEDIRRIWADPHASWPYKLMQTLTDPVIMLAIFVLIGIIALVVLKVQGMMAKGGAGSEVTTTVETPTPTSTEI
jgi:hypothetical protein